MKEGEKIAFKRLEAELLKFEKCMPIITIVPSTAPGFEKDDAKVEKLLLFLGGS